MINKGFQIRLNVRTMKELQCKIKTCFNKKRKLSRRVDTQVSNERGRSCFTVKISERRVLEAEVLKCTIELMRTNTHSLNLTILQQRMYIFHPAHSHTTSKCLLAHSHIHSTLQAQTSTLFFLLSQGLISALFIQGKWMLSSIIQ